MADPENWQGQVDEALRSAVNLDSVPAPAGRNGCRAGPDCGIYYEAVGHGLEGDFNRKKTSSFSTGSVGASPPQVSPLLTMVPT